jgi:hypothetical protein
MGELSMRGCLAHDVVMRLAAGEDLVTAGRAALDDLATMAREFPHSAIMRLVALDRHGGATGFSTAVDGTYVVMKPGCSEPQVMPSVHVEWPGVNAP